MPSAEAAEDVAADDLAADVAATTHAKRFADPRADTAADAERAAAWEQAPVEIPVAGDAAAEWQQAAADAAEPAGSAAAWERHAADVASAVAAVMQCLWLCTGVRPALQQWDTAPGNRLGMEEKSFKSALLSGFVQAYQLVVQHLLHQLLLTHRVGDGR